MIWSSISRSDKEAGNEIVFVIAELAETATDASFAFVPERFIARFRAPETSSLFSIRLSTTALTGRGSTAYDSTQYLLPFTASSSTLTTDELISTPSKGNFFRPNMYCPSSSISKIYLQLRPLLKVVS